MFIVLCFKLKSILKKITAFGIVLQKSVCQTTVFPKAKIPISPPQPKRLQTILLNKYDFIVTQEYCSSILNMNNLERLPLSDVQNPCQYCLY